MTKNKELLVQQKQSNSSSRLECTRILDLKEILLILEILVKAELDGVIGYF